MCYNRGVYPLFFIVNMELFQENEEFKTFHLFSIPLMSFNYGKISEDEHDIFNRYLNNLKQNRINLTTKENYFLDKELPLLKRFFKKCIKTYADNIIFGGSKERNEVEFKITQSWLNVSRVGSLGHHEHTHPNSYISGVFYINVDETRDGITFINEFNSRKGIEVMASEYNTFNASEWVYPVKEGELVIFPSHLIHYVKPIETGNFDRVSLAFNVFPFGNLGDTEFLHGLRIGNDKYN